MHYDVLVTVKIQERENAENINEGNNYIANHDLRCNEVDAMA